jgi:hypothetical protein
MKIGRSPWAWLVALLAGFGLGLAYTWVIAPVKYVDAEPRVLRDDFKDDYRAAIAAAYASNPDLERARARLALLGDPDPSQALAAQAQRMLANGESPEVVQQVAMLASVLQGQAAANPPATTTASPTNINAEASQPIDTPTIRPTMAAAVTTGPTSAAEPTSTPIPLSTATPRPTNSPTPTLGAPYQLVGRDTVCDTELAEGLLQVIVTNATRKQIPGAEIIITWNSGEEHIFTGMKPELGYGYADFLMTPDVTYSVRMADGGTPAAELSIPSCTNTDGAPYQGGIRLTFQQP